MTPVENARFSEATIAMDGKYFMNCTFTKCILVFTGEDCEWMNTSFAECSFRFMGPALRILNVLHSFGLAKDVVLGSDGFKGMKTEPVQ
jgi:hypothetical protein